MKCRFPEAKHVSDEEWLRQSVHESEVRSYWIGYPGTYFLQELFRCLCYGNISFTIIQFLQHLLVSMLNH